MKQALIEYIKNGPNDELYTPDEAVIPIIKYLKPNSIIWECTDNGSSNISKILRNNGFKVISTHIQKNFDFLNDKPIFDFDYIITNPPYSLKNEFLAKCYEYNKPFLLLPITTLEGKERSKMFQKYGIQVLVFDKRINYMKNKKVNWFNTSWFCFKSLPRDLIFEEV